jgi:lysozyme family protein
MAYPEIFNRCIEVVLRLEGGYSNHPSDPGGETKYGICKRNYPDINIKYLTKAMAIDIYFNDYWTPMHLTNIKTPEVTLELFDMGVNAGLQTSIRMLQGVIGADKDGRIGPQTERLVNEYKGDLVDEFKKTRKAFYVKLSQKKPELSVFLPGWLNRVNNCKFID